MDSTQTFSEKTALIWCAADFPLRARVLETLDYRRSWRKEAQRKGAGSPTGLGTQMEWDGWFAAPPSDPQCFPVWWNLWHGAFRNQTAHTARARSTPCVGKSGQASGKSARFPPRAFQQIVLSDVGHPADKASGSVHLGGCLPKPGHLLCVSGALPSLPPPLRLCGAPCISLWAPMVLQGEDFIVLSLPEAQFTLKYLFPEVRTEDPNVKKQCSFLCTDHRGHQQVRHAGREPAMEKACNLRSLLLSVMGRQTLQRTRLDKRNKLFF